MDDQIVSGQVFGKVITGHNVNVQSLAELTTQQTRKLHASNIFMLRHVGASLRYQHAGIGTQSAQRLRPLQELPDVPLLAGKQNGKRSQPRLRRAKASTVGNTCESVIIRDGGDDKTDNVADKRSAVQLQSRTTFVQQVAQGLHLWQGLTVPWVPGCLAA